MATIVLTAVGTMIGGPFGASIGALIGRQIDGAIFRGPTREGPRLKELDVTTSSYGHAIGRHYGQMRVAGTVIWATDLVEHRETSGGGKGQPKVANYSYSLSFAVALASRPIDRVGRIWADGNLLRGAGGDLKTGGRMRLYRGLADQPRDPLMQAALGDQCPAYRGCAYVVFEDLQLADFGNRIPALTFEVFAGSGANLIADLVAEVPGITIDAADAQFPELTGFTHDGGTLGDIVTLAGQLRPLRTIGTGDTLRIAGDDMMPASLPTLPEATAWDDGDFGEQAGTAHTHNAGAKAGTIALRYYDTARDYQPGLQYSDGVAGLAAQNATVDFPGALNAPQARLLARRMATRLRQGGETMAWRCTGIDPAILPGALVHVPDTPGIWRVRTWEWRAGGVELELTRHTAMQIAPGTVDPGQGWSPPDRLPQPSSLRVFELPWDGNGSSATRQIFAAAGAPTGLWSGAELFSVVDESLIPIGHSGTARAISGTLLTPLNPGQPFRFASEATLELQLEDAEAQLSPASVAALAQGANRALLGDELVQFTNAESLGQGRWRLHGLLRGRGGTEIAAQASHPVGTRFTLLDNRLTAIDPDRIAPSTAAEIAAIGLADTDPVIATLENAGISQRPLTPVHPRITHDAEGALHLGWTRRARGGWHWRDEVEQPLIEQRESYDIGLGPVDAPLRLWATDTPALTLDAATLAALAADHPGAPLWVRQRGSLALSPPLLLTRLP